MGGDAQGRPRILVVDDDDLVRWVLVQSLRQRGYEVLAAGTARQALEQFRSADLVLLDWRLPDEDGLEVARRVKEERPERPVILITAHNAAELADAAAPLDVEGVLDKPFDVEVVLRAVREALERRSS